MGFGRKWKAWGNDLEFTGIRYHGNMGPSYDPLGEEGGVFVWEDVADGIFYVQRVINMYHAGSDTDNPEETCIIDIRVDIAELLADEELLKGLASFASLDLEELRANPHYYFDSLEAYTNQFDAGHRCFDSFKDAAEFLISEGVERDELKMYFKSKKGVGGFGGFRLNKGDKRVLTAFLSRQRADSKKLRTDGQRLDGLWLGGSGIAEWQNGELVFYDLGSKAAQTVQRAIQKKAGLRFRWGN